MSDNNSWLDKNLGAQLLSRLVRPGVAQIGMGSTIATRMAQTAHPLPLLDDLEARWQSVFDMQDDALPLVLAQPAQPEANHSWPQKQYSARGSQAKQKPMPVVTPKQTKVAAQETPILMPNPKAEVQTNGKQTFVQPSNAKGETKTAVSPSASATKRQAPSTEPTSAQIVPSQPTSSNKPNTAVSPLPVVRPKQTAVHPQDTNINRKNAPHPSAQGSSNPQVELPATTRNLPPKVTKTAVPTLPTTRRAMPITLPLNKTAATDDARPVLPVVKPKRVANGASQQHTPAPKTAVQFPTVSPKPIDNAQSTSANPAKTSPPLPLVHVSNGEFVSRRHSDSLPLPARKATTHMPVAPAASPTQTSSFTAPSARPSVGVSSNVIQRDSNKTASDGEEPAVDTGNTAVNIDEIVAEVHRQFKRELAIEGERRGVLPWP